MSTCKTPCFAATPEKFIYLCGGFATALLLAIAFPAGDALAAPKGELDASFGEFGRILVPGDHHYFSAIAQLDDGKLLLGSGSDLFRLNSNGSWDDSFGENGTKKYGHFGYCFNPSDLAQQPDGKIILAGVLGGDREGCGPSAATLVRLNSDGTMDTSFGTDGLVSFNLGDQFVSIVSISRVLILDDGHILMGGTVSGAGGSRMMFTRFDADGSPDASFGTGPLAGTTLIDSNATMRRMERQGDGRFIACGEAYSALRVDRINADGSVDSTFGVNGVSQIAFNGDGGFLRTHCVVMPDGSIVLAASVDAWGRFLQLYRLTPEGVRDTQFGSGGELSISLGEDERVETMVVLADGQIGISGSVASQLMFIARIDPVWGQLDPDFGDNGVTRVDFGDGQFLSRLIGGHLLQQADGDLLGIGYVIRSIGNHYSEPPALAFARIRTGDAGHSGFAGFAGPARFHAMTSETPAEAIAAVRRTGGSTGVLSVDFDTVGDTAQAPRDFTATSGTLTWAAGDTETKLIKIPINSPSSGTFWLELSNSTGGLATSQLDVTLGAAPLPPPSGGTGAGNFGGGGGTSGFWLLALLMLAAVCNAVRRKPHSVCSAGHSGVARAVCETMETGNSPSTLGPRSRFTRPYGPRRGHF